MSENGSSRAVARLTLVIAVFTGVLAVTAVIQVLAFIQSQRAFVAPTDTNFASELVVGMNRLPMYLDVRNSGKVTAIVKELNVGVTLKLRDQPPDFKGIKFAIPPVVAGGTTRSFVSFPTVWGEETTSAVMSGTLKFYMFGVIKYEDVFSDLLSWLGFGPRETGFCYVYVPAAGFRNCPEPPYTYAK